MRLRLSETHCERLNDDTAAVVYRGRDQTGGDVAVQVEESRSIEDDEYTLTGAALVKALAKFHGRKRGGK